MSREYEMSVRIRNFDSHKYALINAAACAEWPFENLERTAWDKKFKLCAAAEGKLFGGESEKQFVERLTHAIWKANGAYCIVWVTATYLEDLPCEDYNLNKEEYVKFIKP